MNMTDSEIYAELRDVLAASLRTLPDKPEETPESCLRALWMKAAGVPLSAGSAVNVFLPPLGVREESVLRDLVAARLAGEPLAYLTGRQQFMGLDFIATPQALIPRRETELLVGTVLNAIGSSTTLRSQQIVVDVFTGSGNIPLALAKLAPGPQYYGSDLSPEAIDLARQNAGHLHLESECIFYCGDLLAPFRRDEFLGRIDVISGSPPYISSSKVPNMPPEISKYEPSLAFQAGPFGIALFTRLIKEAPIFLRPGGLLCFEVGRGQGQGTLTRLRQNPMYTDAHPVSDSTGEIRVVMARRK